MNKENILKKMKYEQENSIELFIIKIKTKMKKYYSYLIVVGMFLSTIFTSCNKDEDVIDPGIMQMSTKVVGEVTIALDGTGLITIDWGDGPAKVTETLSFDTYVEFSHNYSTPNIRTIRIYGDNIVGLNCSNNQLTSLDVSRNVALTGLYCFDNQLTSLDISKNSMLFHLGCGGNQLTSLDMTKNVALNSLQCGNNQLTSLDLSKNIALVGLSCWKNQLTSLDMSNNTILIGLNCYSNQLSATELDALFGSLHSNAITGETANYISIYDNPGTTTCNPSIATDRGWTVDMIER